MPVRPPHARAAAWMAAIFVVTLAAYLLSPVRTPFDSRWSVHTAMSFVRGHGGSLAAYEPVLAANDEYAVDRRSGVPRTVYPVGVSLLVAPAVALYAALDPGFEPSLTRNLAAKTEHSLASLICAGVACLFFRLLLAEFGALSTALAGTAAFAFGTTMWSDASRALWQHGPLALFLIAAMLLLQRARTHPGAAAFAGLPLAASYVIRPTAAIPIVVLSLYVLLRHRAQFVRFVAGACVIGLPWLAFNYLTIGRILSDYYVVVTGDTATVPSLPLFGLLGELVSPARGLLIYTPLFLLAPWGLWLALRRSERRGLAVASAAIAAGTIGLIAQWAYWWGGHAYGPRLLTDIVPFLAFLVAYAFDDARRQASRAAMAGCGALLLLSVAMQAPGALSAGPWRWNVDPVNVDTHTARLWDWADPPFLRWSPLRFN